MEWLLPYWRPGQLRLRLRIVLLYPENANGSPPLLYVSRHQQQRAADILDLLLWQLQFATTLKFAS